MVQVVRCCVCLPLVRLLCMFLVYCGCQRFIRRLFFVPVGSLSVICTLFFGPAVVNYGRTSNRPACLSPFVLLCVLFLFPVSLPVLHSSPAMHVMVL